MGTARQEEDTKERARVEALRTFVPVIDNVERALGFAREMAGGERVAEGLQLVVRGFCDAFALWVCDLLLITIEDLVLFPRMFEGYREYRRQVPFFVTPHSIKGWRTHHDQTHRDDR